MSRRILVTGGTGKTGRRVVAALTGMDVPWVTAARSAPPGGVRFDWTDPTTWDAALNGVGAAYLVAPMGEGDPAPPMIQFIETAMEHDVERFVLLSSSLLEPGGPAMGQVHQWLSRSDAEWVVLRPTWFMENFSEGQHGATIRDERAIYTAAGDGHVPFISTWDIAQAAASALTSARESNIDYVLTGSDLLNYDSVAERLSTVVGETVTHRALSFDELVARHIANGLNEAHAQTLAFMDLTIAEGAEDRTTTDLADLIGRPPVSFDHFVKESGPVWERT